MSEDKQEFSFYEARWPFLSEDNLSEDKMTPPVKRHSELCERGGRPGLPVTNSEVPTVSVDVKQH